MPDITDYPGMALPDAPALAQRGAYPVGVTRREFAIDDAIDLANSTVQVVARAERILAAEIWYPAIEGTVQSCTYDDRLGQVPGSAARPDTEFEFSGRAGRDASAAPERSAVVLVAHGHPGSRVLLSYLCEHMASCGRVVIALDHPGSLHGRMGDFADTLLHRSTDVLGALDGAQALDAGDALLGGRLDTERVALIGYSMGGYGVLDAAGARYCQAFIDNPRAVPHRLLAQREHPGLVAPDRRIRAVVAMAPWGGQHPVWDDAGLAALTTPTLFIAGIDDDVVGWDPGVRSLFAGVRGADRHLLAYQNCRHNVAPNPPPAVASSHAEDWAHYAEPNWDLRRLNNINQHFVRAFLERHLDGAPAPALDVIPIAAEGGYALDEAGAVVANPDHWWGFPPRTALGLELHHLRPGQ